jgi:AcrR family transcriptional regulator
MTAAEEVFSERGYYGSSLREVSARCSAAIGLINHYFPSKEALFNAVVDRRRGVLEQAVRTSIARMPARPADQPLAVIEHFITPFLRACVEQANELHRYIKMTSHFMSTYRVPEIRPALQSLKPISDIFRDRLREAYREVPERDFDIAVYLIEAALIFMVQDTGFLESVSDGICVADQIDELIKPAAIFFAAGTSALVARA